MTGFQHRDRAGRQRYRMVAPGAVTMLGAVLAFGQLSPSPGQLQSAAQGAPRNLDAANAERRQQIADDSAKLLQLATGLKAEVDKTDKDTLSLTVIRKADEIEKLAHAVKEKMKFIPGTH
jgi:hypothetical protein